MKILFVHPEYPETFWSFRHALPFISRKAGSPPLGLLTVAALLPQSWEKRLVDITVSPLRDQDILWADYVFIGAMSVQQASVRKIIERCKELDAKIVAGGPLFSTEPDNYPEIDHLILGEAEVTIPLFLKDIENGLPLKRLYVSEERANLQETPIPLWDLLKMKKYAAMSVQYSRGCPFNCEFCNVTSLFGHRVRLKTKNQILAELESLFTRHWRDAVFFVDDNFIGNKAILKKEILPAIIEWQNDRAYPFDFNTQASINLADDAELMSLMVEAGFDTVFIGIETPHMASLSETGKTQNVNRDLVADVKKIQESGLQVQGGFILGFDSDPASIFDRLTDFIQRSGITTAMVGLLNAPHGTRLHQRLVQEKRMLDNFSGDNTDSSINFVPKMNLESLRAGYKKVVNTLYSPKGYYNRLKTFLRTFKPAPKKGGSRLHFRHILALVKSVWFLGIKEKGRWYYWKILTWSLFKKPRLFPQTVVLLIYGFHFRKVFEDSE